MKKKYLTPTNAMTVEKSFTGANRPGRQLELRFFLSVNAEVDFVVVLNSKFSKVLYPDDERPESGEKNPGTRSCRRSRQQYQQGFGLTHKLDLGYRPRHTFFKILWRRLTVHSTFAVGDDT